MTNENSKPREVTRDGAIKATIWENEGEKDFWYSVVFSRTYTDGSGKPQDAYSFSGTELLKLSFLAARAYNRIPDLRYEDHPDAEEAA